MVEQSTTLLNLRCNKKELITDQVKHPPTPPASDYNIKLNNILLKNIKLNNVTIYIDAFSELGKARLRARPLYVPKRAAYIHMAVPQRKKDAAAKKTLLGLTAS